MLSTLMSYSDPMILIVGICLGAVLSMALFIIGSYFDYKNAVKSVKEQFYEEFKWDDILFETSFWDMNRTFQIVLPEV